MRWSGTTSRVFSHSLRWWMFGSSCTVPYSAQATASSPSRTSAACARPSLTIFSLKARLPSSLRSGGSG